VQQLGVPQKCPRKIECGMKTILLIENDPASLVMQSLLLRCFGYSVLEADSRGEAWQVCNEHQGPIHIVMTLHNDSTREFVARLKLLYPQIRAILCVSEAAPAELADMPCEYAFLQVPYRADALACTIRGLLDGSFTASVA
jgi:two-component system sensor histidine kinase EvgS